MSQGVRHHFWLIAIASLILFTNLGRARLWDRDEPRNAGCAVEMMERGDWVTPMFGGELRSHKPVLLYWFMMSAYAVFGVNEFAARFWSAVLAIGTTIATYHIGRRLFDARAGFWAGIAICSSLMFDVAGRAATPDSVLIFFSTMAILAYVLGTFPSVEVADQHRTATKTIWPGHLMPTRWTLAVLMYGMMGFAVLAKGPIGLVLPTAVIGMFLSIVRLPERTPSSTTSWGQRFVNLLRPFAPRHFSKTCWVMRPLTAIAVVAAIAVPWYVWVGIRTDGQWLRGFFVEHNVGRAMQSMEGHGGSILYYPLALLLGFFPWSVLAAPMLVDAFRRVSRRDRWTVGTIFALCWVGVYVGLFSIARTKLPSYVTPCYPGLALLAGSFLARVTRGEALAFAGWPRVSFGALALIGLVMLIGLPIAAHVFLPGEEWLGAIGLIPLAGGIGALVAAERGRLADTIRWLAPTAIALCLVAFGFLTVRVDGHQQSDRMLQVIHERSDQPEIAVFGCMEPSWVFYSRQPIWVSAMDDDAWKVERAKHTRPPQKVWNPRPKVDVVDFLAGSPDRFVITTRRQLEELQLDKQPELRQIEIVSEVPYFLKDETLFVLGWNEQAATVARQHNSEAKIR